MTNKPTNTPFDADKFKEEVEAYLNEIDNPRLFAAFAARVALASLPLLAIPRGTGQAGEEFLWYWKEEDRERHLLAVCRALQVAWSLPTDFAIIFDADAADAADAAYAAHTAAAADAFAAFAAYAAYAAVARVAARAAASAARADSNLIPWIRQELERLARTPDITAYLREGSFPRLPLKGPFLSQLRELPTFDYWADWLQARFDGKPLDLAILEKSVNLPGEIESQGPRAINRYLAGLASGKKAEKIKRVRAIFIGNGDAGKTSLIQALNEREAVGDTEMTPGIEISEWQVGGTGLTAHFWDFGGQVIAHATHQFFLRARCVYVLVLNARSADSNPNQQAEYWLEFARAFGADAPVLLVGNKCDQTPVAVDLNRLREGYPNIRGFHGLSATEYRGKYAREFGIFKDAFIDELTRIGEDARLYFSREEFNLIEALRAQSRQAAFLEKSAFDELCAARGIEEGETRDGFLSLLDQLGEVIHFPELYRAGFKEFLLNPRWLTHGVYRLLYSDTLRNAEGILRWNDIRAVLRDQSIEDEQGNRLNYPEDKLMFLTRAMEAFKLCYPAPHGADTWIVPDLLPSDQPADIGFDRQGALRFDFRFDTFLPRHVLGMFMVAQYRDIQDNLAWQHGVCLASRHWNTRALIRADYQSRVLKLEIAGDHVDSYFAILYESILEILERMPRLGHTQRLHLMASARIGGGRAFSYKELTDEEPTADFGDVLAAKVDGEQVLRCKFGKYDLQMLLHLVPEGITRREIERMNIGSENEEATGVGRRWDKTMLTSSGLGGLAAIIGGLATFFKELTPFPDSLGVALLAIGGAMFIAGALVWFWRWSKIARDGQRRSAPHHNPS